MAGGGYLAVGLIPVTLGLIGAEILPGLEDPEQILPRLAQLHLPGVLYVLFAGALLSAILSTVDSTLLVSSSLVSHNIIVPLRPALSEAWKVRSARIGVAVFGVVAYGMALYAEGVYALVEQASAFGSAGIVVIVTFGLFTRFGGPASALASLLAGVGVWVVGSSTCWRFRGPIWPRLGPRSRRTSSWRYWRARCLVNRNRLVRSEGGGK
jgi:Na+/proline symporter